MPVTYNFKKGTDTPIWQWLPQFPNGLSYHGTSNAWDGTRYMYWMIQYGTTGATTSTTQLWRFDTWTLGWQWLANPTNSGYGLDVEYDAGRNVVYLIHGVALTSWQVFNLNATAVTIANISCPAWALTTITTVLPVAAGYGSAVNMPGDNVDSQIDSGVIGTGSTTTSIVAAEARFSAGSLGTYIRFLDGALAGQRRPITAFTSSTTVTVPALGSAPVAGVNFVIELPEDTATAGALTTLTRTGAGWVVNQYANSDVTILSGTGAGQRRRIASNTADTLTLAAAVTGNARTGNWATAPDATSVFRIVPSADFLYYLPANNTATGMYRLDVAQTTGAAWSAVLAAAPATIGGGANLIYAYKHAPFFLITFRGNGTNTLYMYNLGLNTWTTVPTFWGVETLATGGSSAGFPGKRSLLVYKEGSQRVYRHDLMTGMLEPLGTVPYSLAGAYEGKRVRFCPSADGVSWMYLMRAGGQEFFRVPMEWL